MKGKECTQGARLPFQTQLVWILGLTVMIILSVFFCIEIRFGESHALMLEEGNIEYLYSRNGFRTIYTFIENNRSPKLRFQSLDRMIATRDGTIHSNRHPDKNALFVLRITIPLWLPIVITIGAQIVISAIVGSYRSGQAG